MPQILETIDEIARRLQRDVLFLTFGDQSPNVSIFNGAPTPDWENDPTRAEVLRWLDANGYHHQPCFGILEPGLITVPYNGTVFIDVPFDTSLPAYRILSDYLEEDDHGKTRFAGVTFSCLQLEGALKMSGVPAGQLF